MSPGIYGILLLLYLLSQIHYARLENRKYKAIHDADRYIPFITVIIPFYNEDKFELQLAIQSVLNQTYSSEKYEIICVDDGSTTQDTREYVMSVFGDSIKMIHQTNQGKRMAQYNAVLAANKKSKFLLMLDSDSVLDPNTMVEFTKTVNHYNAKAVTGGIMAKPENTLLNRLLRCRYWTANFQERLSQSYHDQIMCCSGPCTLWDKEMFMRVSKEYISQHFLGQLCTYGDDRHLTNLFLRENALMKMSPMAICYTKTPETWGKWIKQQVRWTKSFYRELLYSLLYLRGKMGWYFLYQAGIAFILPFMLLINIGILLFAGTITFKVLALYLLGVVFAGFLRGIYAFAQTKDPSFFLSPIYAFIHLFLVHPLKIYALFKLKDTKWGTR